MIIFLNAIAALVFSSMGVAYGTTKNGVGVASMDVIRPKLIMNLIVPIVMAGALGIYGLIIAISTDISLKLAECPFGSRVMLVSEPNPID